MAAAGPASGTWSNAVHAGAPSHQTWVPEDLSVVHPGDPPSPRARVPAVATGVDPVHRGLRFGHVLPPETVVRSGGADPRCGDANRGRVTDSVQCSAVQACRCRSVRPRAMPVSGTLRLRSRRWRSARDRWRRCWRSLVVGCRVLRRDVLDRRRARQDVTKTPRRDARRHDSGADLAGAVDDRADLHAPHRRLLAPTVPPTTRAPTSVPSGLPAGATVATVTASSTVTRSTSPVASGSDSSASTLPRWVSAASVSRRRAPASCRWTERGAGSGSPRRSGPLRPPAALRRGRRDRREPGTDPCGLAIARYDSRDGYGRHAREAEYVSADRDTPSRNGCADGTPTTLPADP